MSRLSPVCILAGGVGSRLGAAVADTPKPLVSVAGRPFLFHQLDQLAAAGADRVVLCIGYLGEQIEAAVGDGATFGLRVSYSVDGPTPIGTAAAIRQALPQLGQRFLVLYGDTYLRIDFADVDATARTSGHPALMTVLRNEGRWDCSNVDYSDGRVLRYEKNSADPHLHYIDYGLSVLSPAVFDSSTAASASDLAPVFSELSRLGQLAGYEATSRFYEIGTPAARAEADVFLRGRADAAAQPTELGHSPVSSSFKEGVC